MTRLRFPQALAFLEPKLTTGSLSPDRYLQDSTAELY